MAEEKNEKEKDILELHPKERALIEYIRTLRYGRIEKLEVQDGLPILAENVAQKIKF